MKYSESRKSSYRLESCHYKEGIVVKEAWPHTALEQCPHLLLGLKYAVADHHITRHVSEPELDNTEHLPLPHKLKEGKGGTTDRTVTCIGALTHKTYTHACTHMCTPLDRAQKRHLYDWGAGRRW